MGRGQGGGVCVGGIAYSTRCQTISVATCACMMALSTPTKKIRTKDWNQKSCSILGLTWDSSFYVRKPQNVGPTFVDL